MFRHGHCPAFFALVRLSLFVSCILEFVNFLQTLIYTCADTQTSVVIVGTHDATAEPSLLTSLGRNGGDGSRKARDVSGNNKKKGSGKED